MEYTDYSYYDAHGNRISYGSGGGAFLSCTSSTNQANMECEFGISWYLDWQLLIQFIIKPYSVVGFKIIKNC